MLGYIPDPGEATNQWIEAVWPVMFAAFTASQAILSAYKYKGQSPPPPPKKKDEPNQPGPTAKTVLPIVIATLALAGALALLPAPQAQAQIQVTETGVTGTLILLPQQYTVLTATDFSANVKVRFLINNVKVGEGTTDGTGQYTETIKVPKELTFGPKEVKALAVNSLDVVTYSASITTMIQFAPTTGGPAGSAISVSGFGFSVFEVVTMTFVDAYDHGEADCIDVGATVSEQLGVLTSNKFGMFKLSSIMPSVPAGTYYVVAVGENSATCAVY